MSRKAETPGAPLSPRATQGLLLAAKAWALLEGRDHVRPCDVQAVFRAVCEHRMDAGQPTDTPCGYTDSLLKQVEAIR